MEQSQTPEAGGRAKTAEKPLVSIGLPVYNGGRYLRQTLESILTQTFSDFELIISDNASEDATEAICREVAAADARVKYIRQKQNIGAPRNWNAVLYPARGEYFKWASSNDYCAPKALELCVAALQGDAGAVLSFGRTELIHADGRSAGVYPGDLAIPDARPSERIERVRRDFGMNNAQQGLIRRDILMRTPLDRPYPGGDIALMAELALYGRFLLVPEVLLFRRMDSVMANNSATVVQRMYNPQRRKLMKLVRSRFHWDLFVTIARAPIPAAEKMKALGDSMKWATWERVTLMRELISLVQPTRKEDGASGLSLWIGGVTSGLSVWLL